MTETLHRWREKYGGMEASEARRLRELEYENFRLKRPLAEQLLRNQALKDLLDPRCLSLHFIVGHGCPAC